MDTVEKTELYLHLIIPHLVTNRCVEDILVLQTWY